MKKAATQVTQRDIQKALRKFKLAGGKIQKIPDQVAPRLAAVRSRWDSLAALADAPTLAPTVAPDATAPSAE